MAVKRILAYLRGTIGHGIRYGGVENEKQLVAYTDADFAANIDDRRSNPTPLLCDNQSAIRLVRNPELHQRTKHIDVKYHFIRSLQDDGTIDATYVNTEAQLANILTKGLESARFRRLRSSIGVEDFVAAGLGGCVGI